MGVSDLRSTAVGGYVNAHLPGLPVIWLKSNLLFPGNDHVLKLHEVDLPVAVGIRLPDHVLDLLSREVLAQGLEDAKQLLLGDVPIAVGVEGSAWKRKKKTINLT